MITIGRRILLASFPQLLIPKDDDVVIDIDVQGWKLKVTIHFDDASTEQAIAIAPVNDGVRLVFQNWSNSIGIALKTPAQLAKLAGGGSLEFMAANYRIGDTNIFSIQFLHNKEGK